MTEPATDAGDGLHGFCPWAAETDARLYLRPRPHPDPGGLPLAGGPLRFDRADLLIRRRDIPAQVAQATGTVTEIRAWAQPLGLTATVERWLARLTAPRLPLAGLPLDRPRIMGIVNTTPDSFSDGGDHADPAIAIAAGRRFRALGAEIVDIGGESTRPGAEPVSIDAEIFRTRPVIEALAADGALISIDSRNAAVMQAALEAGAVVINDVTALSHDPAALALAAARPDVPVILMHIQGEPRTMQQDPRYDHAPLDVFDWLADRIAVCEAAGIARERLVVDPGIGFGKSVRHNAELLRHTALLHGLGCPVLIGVSRKSFIGALSRLEPAKERVPGSLAAGLWALSQGAQILRVHDVAATCQARAVWDAIGDAL